MSRRLLALTLTGMLLLSGCWSRREINDLGPVISLGIDRTDDGQLDVTLAIGQPGASPGGKVQKGPSRLSRVILRRQGDTIADALRLAELSSPRRIALDHSQIILFGERFAHEGVDALLDFLLRSPEVRLSARVLMVQGATPTELMVQEPLMRSTQSEALRELESARAGYMASLKEFFIARSTAHISPIISTVRLIPHSSSEAGGVENEVELSGAAIFRDDRVVLTLDESEVRAGVWLKKNPKDAAITAPCPGGKPGKFSVQVTRAKREIEPAVTGGKLSFRVDLTVSVKVVDIQCHEPLTDPKQLVKLADVVGADLTGRISETVRKLQEHKVDPWGFGELVRAKHPALWREVGGERWFETWAEVPVRVTAKLDVVHLNLSNQPPILEKKPSSR